MTRAELDASFPANKAYRDPEQGEGIYRFDPEAQAEYRLRRDEHFTALKADWRKHDIRAQTACIEDPVATVLRSWLRQAGRP